MVPSCLVPLGVVLSLVVSSCVFGVFSGLVVVSILGLVGLVGLVVSIALTKKSTLVP